jgi:hypothetical protein
LMTSILTCILEAHEILKLSLTRYTKESQNIARGWCHIDSYISLVQTPSGSKLVASTWTPPELHFLDQHSDFLYT